MGYDVKCDELARAFLSDHPGLDTDANVRIVAQAIQDAIEAAIEDVQPAIVHGLNGDDDDTADDEDDGTA